MKLSELLEVMFADRVYIGEHDLLAFIVTRVDAVPATHVLEEMVTSGFVSTITIRDRNIYVLGTERIEIRRDGDHPCSMGF